MVVGPNSFHSRQAKIFFSVLNYFVTISLILFLLFIFSLFLSLFHLVFFFFLVGGRLVLSIQNIKQNSLGPTSLYFLFYF